MIMVENALEKLSDRRQNNFNLIRLLAAIGVIITHSYAVLGQPESDLLAKATNGILSFSRLGVYVFFIISGFLIAQSLERSKTIVSFYWKRFLRIFPALVVAIVVTVFVLGSIMTTLSLSDYFKNPGTYRYLGGMTLYRITYKLPGVFADNLRPNTVNGSLWTLPYEWTCYVVLSFFVFLIKKKKKAVFLLFFFLVLIVRITWGDHLSDKIIPILYLNALHMINYSLFFFSGVLSFVFKDHLRFSPWYALIGVVIIYLGSRSFWGIYALYCILAYLVLYLAIVRMPLKKFFLERDYSYGMYIFVFPIQQVLSQFFSTSLNVASLALLAIICTAPLAVLSWHFVEKPALKLK